MVKRPSLFRRSITSRLTGMMLLSIVIFFVGSGIISVIEHNELNGFQRRADELARKQRMIAGITQNVNDIVYRSRGFFLNRNDTDYDRLMADLEAFKRMAGEFRQLRLEPNEADWVDSLDRYLQVYYGKTLPEAKQYAQNRQPDRLNDLYAGGLEKDTDELLAGAKDVQHRNQDNLEQAQAKLDDRLASQATRFLLFATGLLLVSIYVVYRMAKDISIPISRLSGNAKAFPGGAWNRIEYTDRQDEIGELARSLESMAVQINAKGEELLAQNEELTAQQDELQMQQEELNAALRKMEDNERYLVQRNRLVQSLAASLDRDELLQSIVCTMLELLKADKGIMLLAGPEKAYAASGLSEAAVRRFLDSCDDGLLALVEQTKRPYTLHRQATPGEQGYLEGPLAASDMFVPVPDAAGEIAAYLVFTRAGRPFTAQEEEDASAFAIQISLSLEKLRMYESAEGQRRLTQNMLNTIQEGIQLIDLNGKTIQVNSKWYELMGLEDATSIAMELPAFRERLRPLVKDAGALEAFIGSIVSDGVDEERSMIYEMTSPVHRYIRMYSEPLYRGSTRLGALLVHRDITKEYEADLLKSEFVSTVSHELRTPLASVLGFAELLLYKQLTPERQKKYVLTIHQEATRLTGLINDFLDLQRMESGKMAYHFEPTAIAELVREAIELYQVNAPAHRFVFADTSDGAKARADVDKIKQVLMNIIGNAVKYSPDGGAVTVTCGVEDGYLVVEVADEGLGIPREAMSKLFNKFYRVDNTDRREIGGTGLGLAIVKEIMAIHGGDVRVDSVYGEGSAFKLLLPLAEPEREQDGAVRGEHQSLVYIVEDDASLSALLGEELAGSGYAVERFVSGEEAMAAMAAAVPDAVVLDLTLGGGMNGLAVIERMKREAPLARVPILVSSALDETEEVLQLGVKGYLVKPYQPNRLSEAVTEALDACKAAGA